jgi:hypothetical protein
MDLSNTDQNLDPEQWWQDWQNNTTATTYTLKFQTTFKANNSKHEAEIRSTYVISIVSNSEVCIHKDGNGATEAPC